MTYEIPTFVTHYYRQHPFRSLTALCEEQRATVIADLEFPPEASHRFHSAYYFEHRTRYESVMRDQFARKGGSPALRHPHYAVLGESKIWESIATNSVRINLTDISSDEISFTYTDSWFAYVSEQEDGTTLPRKPQYNMVYRIEELPQLFAEYGWPGDRWKNEASWENDIYVEAQIWSDSVRRIAPTTKNN